MFAPANVAQFRLLIPGSSNDFKVLAFKGTEAISALYAIQIELVSEYPDFDLESLLNQPAFLQFGLRGEGIHGRIEAVLVGESGTRLTHYRLTLVPVLHYLQFSRNHRIFQQLNVPQIIKEVFKGHNIFADAFTFHVSSSPQREYCTQYGETDFEFVQRLCAEDGIAWHHSHTIDDHHLVFSDHQSSFQKLGETPYRPATSLVAEQPVVSQFSVRFSTRTSATTLRDYDLNRPSRVLEGAIKAVANPVLEDYRYPAPIQTEERGKQLARQALERSRFDYQLAEGKSDQPTLRSGYFLDLTEHPRKQCNDLWLLISVTHEGKQPQSLEETDTHSTSTDDGFTQGYRNEFSATPWDVFYRPPTPQRKPLLASQTAVVTGPAGEEIFCDEFGRVKVRFHWDRVEPRGEKSSCWLRVSSGWAGDSFGAVTIPRIGMEVLVTYLEGDPDQPLITGCVPNLVNSVPYPLPAHKSKTVMRSQSTPRSGGYNELSIDDHAGLEKIFLRAQRDLEQLILRDSDTRIGNDRREQVEKNSSSLIKGNEQHTTEGLRETMIGGDELLSIKGNSSTTANGTLVIQAGPHAHVTAANVVIDAGTSLTLKAGGHHIVINPAGIFTSTDLDLGGVPQAGILPLQALASAPQALIVSPASIVAATKQHATDFCPLCEACLDDQCGLGGIL